ncbi:hypothetical protein GCM10010228_81300 [Streptomyces massasporeus]|nr:hypothetical protein GCM10010228_81300 [Streptomyces massasporeus]
MILTQRATGVSTRCTVTAITAALLMALTACEVGDDNKPAAAKPSASPSVDRAGHFIGA